MHDKMSLPLLAHVNPTLSELRIKTLPTKLHFLLGIKLETRPPLIAQSTIICRADLLLVGGGWGRRNIRLEKTYF